MKINKTKMAGSTDVMQKDRDKGSCRKITREWRFNAVKVKLYL
jgi:hypothetical protein